MGSAATYQTTTLRLPKQLYEQARAAVRDVGAASSLNEFVVEALTEKLRQLREQEIDKAFADMATDAEYQKEALDLSRAFAVSDWQAYQSQHSKTPINERRRKKGSSKTSTR